MDSVIEPRIGTVIGNSLYIHPISYTDAGRLCASSISCYISVITSCLSAALDMKRTKREKACVEQGSEPRHVTAVNGAMNGPVNGPVKVSMIEPVNE